MSGWPAVDNPRQPTPGRLPSRLDLLLLGVLLLLFPPVGLVLLLITKGLSATFKVVVALLVTLLWAIPVAFVLAR